MDLQAWDASDSCKIIVIKGSGDKAFCAGGDIRQLFELVMSGNLHEAYEFAAEEYKLNHLIATLKTPFVAILNGITSKELMRHVKFSMASEVCMTILKTFFT